MPSIDFSQPITGIEMLFFGLCAALICAFTVLVAWLCVLAGTALVAWVKGDSVRDAIEPMLQEL